MKKTHKKYVTLKKITVSNSVLCKKKKNPMNGDKKSIQSALASPRVTEAENTYGPSLHL